ncbi:MAG TPA: hypothetical protein VGE43_03720, partial [Acidimicrobiales bacterium]
MSRLEIAADSAYGAANLPYGIYSVRGREPRACTRYGDHVVDLAALLDEDVFAEPTLNPFLAQGHERWDAVRTRLAEAITGEVPDEAVHPIDAVTLHLPFEVADYVDFYAS